MDAIKEVLRDTGEFAEEDIEASIRFVADVLGTAQLIQDAMIRLPSASKLLGIKRED